MTLDLPNLKIQYPINEDTKRGLYKTALYFTIKEYEALTQEELDLKVKESIADWISCCETIEEQEAIPYTVEELQQLKSELEAQLKEVQAELDDVNLTIKNNG